MEAVVNAEGVSVYPSAAAAILDDHSNVIFDDEQYKTLAGIKEEAKPEGETEIKPTEEVKPSEEVKPVTEEVKPTEEKAVVETKVEIDYDKLAEEKTSGKFKKFDDLLKATEEKKYANEESKRIHELLLTGDQGETAVHEYLSAKRLLSGVDKLKPDELVKLKIQLENPEWTEKQVNDDYELDFGLEVSESDASDAILERAKSKQAKAVRLAAKDALAFLEGLKKDIKLPDLKNEAAEELASIRQEQGEFQKMNDSLVSSLDKDFSKITELDLSFSDKDVQFDHKYAVTDVEKKQAAEEIKNYWQTFQSSYYKDGQWQIQKMMEDRLFLANKEKILKSAVTKASTLKKIDTVKGIANATLDKPVTVPENFAGDAARKEFAKFALM